MAQDFIVEDRSIFPAMIETIAGDRRVTVSPSRSSVASQPNERRAGDLCRVWSERHGRATLALVMDRYGCNLQYEVFIGASSKRHDRDQHCQAPDANARSIIRCVNNR